MAEQSNKTAKGSSILAALHDPVRLRIAATAIVLAVGYGAIYTPFVDQIETTSRKLNKEHEREKLADNVEHLRTQVEQFSDRVPEDADVNLWIQHVLGGIRKLPLKLKRLDSEKPRDVGPLTAVVLRVELEGAFEDHDAFLEWLEDNEWIFRVESVKFATARGGGQLVMQLTLLGLTS